MIARQGFGRARGPKYREISVPEEKEKGAVPTV
jgi:hypothetical protein